jgi:hypothetical protein
MVRDMAQVLHQLPNKPEDLSLNPCTAKTSTRTKCKNPKNKTKKTMLILVLECI